MALMFMRIIYIHQYFNTLGMTGGTRSYEMALRLVKAGHEVNIITSLRDMESNDNEYFITNESGIQVHWVSVQYSNHLPYYKRILSFFRFAFKAARIAVAVGGDIIFATSTPLTVIFPARYASYKLKIPIVFEVRDLWPEIPIAMGVLKTPITRYSSRWLEKWAYNNSEAVIALSPAMRDGIVDSGYSYDRIVVIPNSCDIHNFDNDSGRDQFRKERRWLGDKPLILYAGTFGRINGVDYLVDLAYYLKTISPDIRILLVGDGYDNNKIITLAKQKNVLNKNLFIELPMPKSDMPTLFAAADISTSLFIDLPAMQANSANKFFDTLAAGRPILINYGGWQADLIRSTHIGLVSYGADLEAFSHVIAEAANDKKWVIDTGVRSKIIGSKLFHRDKLAIQLEKTLHYSLNKEGHKVSKICDGKYIDMLVDN